MRPDPRSFETNWRSYPVPVEWGGTPAAQNPGWETPGTAQATTPAQPPPGTLPPPRTARAKRRSRRRAAINFLLVAAIIGVPAGVATASSLRPRIVDADLQSTATAAGRGQAPDASRPGAAGDQAQRDPSKAAPAPPAAAGTQGTAEEPGGSRPGDSDQAGGPSSSAGQFSRVASAIVRVEKGTASAADDQAVCGLIDCSASGGAPDRQQVRELLGALDAGLIGPASVAQTTGLSESEARQLIAAVQAARNG